MSPEFHRPQFHINWNSRCDSEFPALEDAGHAWRCALLVVQARTDNDDELVSNQLTKQYDIIQKA